MAILLFISVLLIAACGLVYELIAGTLASYLLGDSVLQFSTVIGSYLFAMGIGSALSRFLHRGLAYRFVWVELAVALVGGFSSALLFLMFAYTQGFQIILYAIVIIIGMLVGLEIPLLMRIVRGQYSFRDAVARAHLRLSGSSRCVASFSDLARAQARPGSLGHAVRSSECRRSAVEHVSVCPPFTGSTRTACRMWRGSLSVKRRNR